MDPKLTEQLQQTLAALLANAQDAAAWTKGQIPLLVQEKILFGRVNETVQAVFAAAVLYACFYYCRLCVTTLKQQSRYDDETGYIAGTIVTGLGVFISVCVLASQLQAVAMVWFAPRLYIVEWLMTQVKK